MADFYIVPPRLTVGSFDRADAVTSLNSLKGDITITADPSTGLRVSISSGQFAFSITPDFYIKKSGDTVPGNIRFTPSGSNYGLAVAAGAANPGTGTTGALFLNTADGKLKYHDGWNWQDITAVAGIALTTADLRYLKLDGTNTPSGNISMGSQFLRFANLATQVLAGSAGQVFYNTDTNKLNVYNGSAWTAVGSGITSISVGTGLTTATSPITDSGTISVNQAYDFTWTGNHTFNNVVNFAAAGQTFAITKLFSAGQATGDLIYFDGSNWNRFGIGTTNQVLSINASGSGLTWAAQTGGGGAGTVYNGIQYSIPYYPSTGAAVTGSINFQNTGTGISIAYTSSAINSSSGALTVLGGVGIGGSLFSSSSYPNSISGVILDNGVITSGSWAGSTITGLYGGTGLTSYTVGDILYAATSSSLGKLSAGTAGSVLVSAGAGATPYYLGQLGLAVGTAVTSSNINIVAASTNATHPLVFTPVTGTQSGVAVSSRSTITFNPSTDIMSVSGLAVTSSSSAINSSTGALIVTGGVGIGGTLFSSSAFRNSISGVAISNGVIQSGSWAGSLITGTYGGTGFSTYIKGDLLVGAGSTIIKLGVGANNQILYANSDAGSGLSWGIFADPTYGSFYSTQTQTVTGVGITTPILFNSTYESNRVQIYGGSGTSSRIQIQDTGPFSLTFSAQINLASGSSPVKGDIWFRINGQDVAQSNSEMTIAKRGSQIILTVNLVKTFTANDYFELMMSSDDANYQIEALTGLTTPPRPDVPSIILSVLPVTHIVNGSGLATSGIQVLNGSTNNSQYFLTGTTGTDFTISTAGANHTFSIPDASTTARGLITTGSQTLLGSKTFASGVAITATTASIGTTSGALIVTGGVGIGGSLFSSSSYANLISGVGISNGVIFIGTWTGSTITGLYGGTGYTNYTKGDLLVGAGNTFVKVSAGTNGYVLGANSNLPSGLGWTTVSGVAISTSTPAAPKNADLWFNSEDGSLSVYYEDVDTSQWVEIAVGSGIDLTNTVHITSTVGSTSLVTGALIVDGGAGIAGTVNAQSFVINELYDQIGTSLTTSATTTNQVALTLSSSAYRSAKIFVQASSGSTFHSQEILMMHDGSNVYMTEYSIINTGAIGSTFDADLNGGNMRFLVSPTFAVTTYKIACTAMRI